MSAQDNIEYELTQDFIFFTKLVRPPELVFQCESRDCKLATAWLDKLSTMHCEDLEDLRMRNIYMSHLLVCLNQGKLIGPFLTMPKSGRFEKSDFNACAKPTKVCPKPKETNVCPKPNQPCECEFVCCNDDGGCCKSQLQNFCGFMTQHINMPKIFNEIQTSLMENKPGIPVDKPSGSSGYQGKRHGSVGKQSTFCTSHVNEKKKEEATCEEKEMYARISVLQALIAAELRGETTPGSNDFLEYELARYKGFIMNHPNMACTMLKLQAKPTLRSFLLLNLQKDLVKLANEK